MCKLALHKRLKTVVVFLAIAESRKIESKAGENKHSHKYKIILVIATKDRRQPA